MSAPRRAFGNISFGGRVPPIVGALIVATLVVSIVSAPGLRFGTPIAMWGTLVPGEVMRGQLWRLVTWVLFASSPISLAFDCLLLYWCGKELVAPWGTRRFLTVYLGTAVASGALVTLLSRLLNGDLSSFLPFPGADGAASALVIYWALTNPDRMLNFFLVLPLRGRTLVLAALAVTALFAAYNGVTPMLPEIAGEVMALAFMYRGRVLRPLGGVFRRRKPLKKSTSFQVWDEEKQRFRPPKWMN